MAQDPRIADKRVAPEERAQVRSAEPDSPYPEQRLRLFGQRALSINDPSYPGTVNYKCLHQHPSRELHETASRDAQYTEPGGQGTRGGGVGGLGLELSVHWLCRQPGETERQGGIRLRAGLVHRSLPPFVLEVRVQFQLRTQSLYNP